MAGIREVLLVPLLLSFLAMPRLYCFLRAARMKSPLRVPLLPLNSTCGTIPAPNPSPVHPHAIVALYASPRRSVRCPRALCDAAVRWIYNNASWAILHPAMSLRIQLSHLVGHHIYHAGETASESACTFCCAASPFHSFVTTFCQEHFPSCPDSASAPGAHAAREHRWHHVVHSLFECPGVSGLGSAMASTLLWEDLFPAWTTSTLAPRNQHRKMWALLLCSMDACV